MTIHIASMIGLVWPYFVSGFLCIVIGVGCGFLLTKFITSNKNKDAFRNASKLMEDALLESKSAKKEAQTAKKEAMLEAREEIQKLKLDFDIELRDQRTDIQRMEDRVVTKEELLTKKENELNTEKEKVEEQKKELNLKTVEITEKENLVVSKLEQVAKLTCEEAKKEIIDTIEDEAKKEASGLIRKIEAEAKEDADKKAKEIIGLAIQRCATDHTADVTVSVVSLPNDDIKGKIIGREGRNIRAIENATGVDLIVDDTPEAITISSFDPIRREIARVSLEKLILDGRIHPARIEEIVEKVKKDIDAVIKEAGDLAAIEADIHSLHPEISKTLGRLKYRTSYGQNVLKHSLEVCFLAGLMAAELGVNVMVAKRGGLLHDLGKAVDFEKEGTHVQLGVEIARKYKESEAVINCIESHHGDVEPKSIEAILVQAADAISSSRPGARKESLENYIKRLKQLEAVADSFKGVEKSYAIQAGREIRIIVKPGEIDDSAALYMAKDIAKKIESEMEYPGQIKVNVIRETRNVEYAK